MSSYRGPTRLLFSSPSCSLRPEAATARGLRVGLARAHAAHDTGKLLKPSEAMALALIDSRDKETLFSLARQAAFETEGDLDDILCHLGKQFPDYA